LFKIEKETTLIPERKPGTPTFKDILAKTIKDVKLFEDGSGSPVSVTADKEGNIRMQSDIDDVQFQSAVESAVSEYVKKIFNL
jgi:hypothetical protein